MMNWCRQRRMQVLLLFLAFLAAATTQEEAVASSFGRYHAVVIGNQTYQYLKKLNTPLNDAEEIARILKEQYGFNVTLLLDKKRNETIRALAELRRTMKKEDNLLIYYAGHGYLDKVTKVGYWQPIDAERDIDVNWISSDYLTSLFKGLQANHILVIADSCFSGNLLTRDSGAALDYGKEVLLQRMRDSKSRTAFTSGGNEEVIDGGGGNHSIFAKSLIDVLRNNNIPLDGQSLSSKVNLLVVANAAQTPRYGGIPMTGHEFGDFIFVPKSFMGGSVGKPPGGSIPGLTRGEPVNEDKHDWERLAVKGEDGYKSYLLLHSNGTYANEARRRIKAASVSSAAAIKKPPHVAITSQDQAQALYEWQNDIIYANNSQAVVEFLQRFPTGSHVPDAKRKLAELRAQGL